MADINQILEGLRKDYPNIQYVNPIKPGKEAEVHLVQAGSDLYALKHYKLGIKFASRKEYFTMGEILDSREARAIKRNTKFGKRAVVSSWAFREYDALRKLSSCGAAVPKVYKFGGDYVLQEFIGNGVIAAPQIYRLKLTREQARNCFEQVVENIEIFWRAGYVHGDLSAYNILWAEGKAVIIDFPQVILTSQNEDSPAKLLRDIENIGKYFEKYEIDRYEDMIGELRELAFSYWL